MTLEGDIERECGWAGVLGEDQDEMFGDRLVCSGVVEGYDSSNELKRDMNKSKESSADFIPVGCFKENEERWSMEKIG